MIISPLKSGKEKYPMENAITDYMKSHNTDGYFVFSEKNMFLS